ncbi:hypothetical protein MAJ_03483, partial [Metarhizium majus ARSEF 297]
MRAGIAVTEEYRMAWLDRVVQHAAEAAIELGYGKVLSMGKLPCTKEEVDVIPVDDEANKPVAADEINLILAILEI